MDEPQINSNSQDTPRLELGKNQDCLHYHMIYTMQFLENNFS